MYIQKFIYTTIGITLITLTLFGQESQNEKQWSENGRFGIGVGYNFLNTQKLNPHLYPYEISAKMNITKRHSIYINVPLKSTDHDTHRDEWGDMQFNIYNLNKHHDLWGLGMGYNYNIPLLPYVNGLVGVGFEYLNIKTKDTDHLTFYYYVDKNHPFDKINKIDKIDRKAYSCVPQIGINYKIRFIEAELKYKFNISRTKMDSRISANSKYYYVNKPIDEYINIEEHRSSKEMIYYQGFSLNIYFLF